MRAALRHPSFRWLWIGQSVSMIGDRMVAVALALFVTDLTGDPRDVGLVLAAYTGPLVLLLLLGGVWADRLPRHRLMMATDLIRGTLHAGLAVLILLGEPAVWQVMAIAALFGSAEAFFRPAYYGLVPQTVPEELVQEATALGTASESVAEFAGPALATALVLGVGAGAAFAIDAATFFVSAACLLRVRPRARGEAPAREPLLAELRHGYREVRSRAWVWVTIVLFSGILTVSFAPFMVLGPTVAEEVFGGKAAFGVTFAVLGAGTVVGSLIGLRWRPERPMLTAMLVIVPWSVTPLVFGLGAPLAAVWAVALAAGVGLSLFGVWWQTALAQRIPPAALSRVIAYDWMGSLAMLPLGYALAGTVAAGLGAREVLAGGAALGIAFTLLCLVPRETRELRRLDALRPG